MAATCGWNLATGSATLVPLPEEVLRRFIGGIGLGTWILTRENPGLR